MTIVTWSLVFPFYAFGAWFPQSVGWIAGRNTLLAALFGLLTFSWHVRGRLERNQAWGMASLVAFMSALLAGEIAVSALGLLFGYALCLDPAGPRAGLARVLPHLTLCTGYVFVYSALGYVTTLHLGAMRAHNGKPRPLLASVLYAGGGPFELRRVGPRTLEMSVTRGWLSTALKRLTRDVGAEPFVVGRVYRAPGLTARVLSVNARGTPTAMHFEPSA